MKSETRNPKPERRPKSEARRGASRLPEPQPNCAKRLVCDQLAGAFGQCGASHSGSKLRALQTLRAVRLLRGVHCVSGAKNGSRGFAGAVAWPSDFGFRPSFGLRVSAFGFCSTGAFISPPPRPADIPACTSRTACTCPDLSRAAHTASLGWRPPDNAGRRWCSQCSFRARDI